MSTSLIFLLRKINPLVAALISATLIFPFITALYIVFEPTISHAVEDTFTVTQTVTAEISFVTSITSVAMDGSIAGLTGGTANGQTQTVVRTNNNAGYNMTIDFASSSYGTAAMNQNDGSGYISDYTPAVAGVPDYSFSSENYAQFAYTMSASTTADLATAFRNNGSACNNDSGGDTAANCWSNPTTSATTIVNTSAATPGSGATSTVHFRVNVPNNPSPIVPSGNYTATATLTAVMN